MSWSNLEEKKAFFNVLDNLRKGPGDQDEITYEPELRHRQVCKAFFGSLKSKTSSLLASPATTPVRRLSQGKVIEATPTADNQRKIENGNRQISRPNSSFIEETPVPDSARPAHPLLRRSLKHPKVNSPTSLAYQSPSMGSSIRKRKRETSRLVPEEKRVLKKLSLFFIPDNDIAPARKIRIERAREHGATWTRTLRDATHVVVDKTLTYDDIKKTLENASSPPPVIVNEDFTVDCIRWGKFLNHDQDRYRIRGQPAVDDTEAARDTSESFPTPQSSDHSLQVKTARGKPGKGRNVPSDATPEPSQGSLVGSNIDVNQKRGNGEKPAAVPSDISSDDEVIEDSILVREGPEDQQQDTRQAFPKHRDRLSPNDELSDMINLMHEYKDLPLDEEEAISDTESHAGQEIDSNDEPEYERPAKKPSIKVSPGGKKIIAFEDRFACNRGGTKDNLQDAENPNAKTIESLQRMSHYYERTQVQWKPQAYRRAIATLRRQTTKIATEQDAAGLPGIGPSLAKKIEELARTNRLRRLEQAENDPRDQILATFLGIYDVGAKTASRWIAHGCRTLDDVRARADLTRNHRIGLEHYDDLNTRIPRAEVAALGACVARVAHELDPSVELVVGGSYRRGSESSGDVDFIVTQEGTTKADDLVPFLQQLLDVLTTQGLIVCTLVSLHSHRPHKDGSGSKWHGCGVLPLAEAQAAGVVSRNQPQETYRPVWRRIDFLLVPETEYGAALLYYTGNDVFNRSMRLLASKKGMRLNQRGLYKEVLRGRGREKITEGELVEGRNEKRIFEILGVQWREPTERWC